eukprot:11684545-Alexandrium_andersonii.AAC.1
MKCWGTRGGRRMAHVWARAKELKQNTRRARTDTRSARANLRIMPTMLLILSAQRKANYDQAGNHRKQDILNP